MPQGCASVLSSSQRWTGSLGVTRRELGAMKRATPQWPLGYWACWLLRGAISISDY